MEYKSNCNYYRIIAFAILLLGFILGIVFGSVFSTDAVSGYSEETVESFNCTLMLSTWFSSFILSVFILGIYSICIRLEVIANNTNKDKKTKTSKHSIHQEEQTKLETSEKRKEEKFIWE